MKNKYVVYLVLITSLFISPSLFGLSFPVDTMRILGVLVEFQEDNASTTTGDGKFDLSQPSVPYQIDPPPHNRTYFQDHLTFLKNYFLRVSRGSLYIEADVFPAQETAFQLPHPMTYYNPNTTPDEINTRLARLLQDALREADNDAGIDFSKYKSFIVFHAGVGKDVDLGFDETPQDIPSLFITSDFLQKYLGQPYIEVQNGQVKIPNGILLPETESQDGFELGLNGMVISNFGSQLGWLDLFSPETRRTGVGVFAVMDVGLFNANGLLPALPCAWTRIEQGWEIPEDIYYSSNDLWTIHSTLSSNPDRVYRIPINKSEYFLIENRFAGKLNLDSLRFKMSEDREEFATYREVLEIHFSDQVTFSERGVLIDVKNPDIGLPGGRISETEWFQNTGCLIWHIDENVIEGNRSENRINADPEHRGVDLEEADGAQNIGLEAGIFSTGVENGYFGDVWFESNPFPLYKNEFTPNSKPNSRSYYNRANSHISIMDFSVQDSVMNFLVTMNIYQQHFPVQINPENYGTISSMASSDLDVDGKRDLVITTDAGKVLVLNDSARSVWGSDSFEIANFDQDIITPPVIIKNPLASTGTETGVVVLSQSGKVYGLLFKSDNTIDSLFSPFVCGEAITTYPVGVEISASAYGVYWGSENGRIYNLLFDENGVNFDSSASVNEPIRHLHINAENQILTITGSGKIYRDNEILGSTIVPEYSPVGDDPVAVSADGRFIILEEIEQTFAEDRLFRFDSPLISIKFDSPGMTGNPLPGYFVAGNNRLLSFNYNFTLSENYPVKLYKPHRETGLFLSPLFGKFYDSGQSENFGVIVTDPEGLIDGYDLKGNRLANFPLAVGDSILVPPLLTNLDNDTDVELIAVTKGGLVYAWDLPATFFPSGWNQLYADELNSNRSLITAGITRPDLSASGDLLPENEVYNWPNPNEGDFTFIRYSLTAPARVNIKIFDLAGDLVDEFAGTGNALTANEVLWDLTRVQNGVYLARVEASNSDKSEVRFIKIAVIK